MTKYNITKYLNLQVTYINCNANLLIATIPVLLEKDVMILTNLHHSSCMTFLTLVPKSLPLG